MIKLNSTKYVGKMFHMSIMVQMRDMITTAGLTTFFGKDNL